MEGSTEIVAWWGAIVATLVLAWDVIKWLRTGPKIRGSVTLDVTYGDGELLSTESTPHGRVSKYQDYCNIEVVNTGSQPTTILDISATHKKHKDGFKFGATGIAFKEHFGKTLPHVLGPGEVWSCRLSMDRYRNIAEHGQPEIHLNFAHLKKPMVLRASKIR